MSEPRNPKRLAEARTLLHDASTILKGAHAAMSDNGYRSLLGRAFDLTQEAATLIVAEGHAAEQRLKARGETPPASGDSGASSGEAQGAEASPTDILDPRD